MSRREIILQRKRQQRIRGIMSISALILSIVIVFSVCGLSGSAHSSSEQVEYKYFTNYEIAYGDSLWEIASVYCDAHYASLNDYIEEVCIINSIPSDSRLIAGTHLILPYYSTEFKY